MEAADLDHPSLLSVTNWVHILHLHSWQTPPLPTLLTTHTHRHTHAGDQNEASSPKWEYQSAAHNLPWQSLTIIGLRSGQQASASMLTVEINRKLLILKRACSVLLIGLKNVGKLQQNTVYRTLFHPDPNDSLCWTLTVRFPSQASGHQELGNNDAAQNSEPVSLLPFASCCVTY